MTKGLEHNTDAGRDMSNGIEGGRRARELDLIARILPGIQGVRTNTILEVEAAVNALRGKGEMPKLFPANVPPSAERFKEFEIKDLPMYTATRAVLSRGKIGKDIGRHKNKTVQELIDFGEEAVLDFAKTASYRKDVKVLFGWLERAATEAPLTAAELTMSISELLLTPEVKERLMYEYDVNDYERERALGYCYGYPGDLPKSSYRFGRGDEGNLELTEERKKLLKDWECIEYPDSGSFHERSDAHVVFRRPKSSIKTLGDLLRLGNDGLEDKIGIRSEDIGEMKVFLENFCNTRLPRRKTRE
ncbi:MAG: hypothetical protein NTX63_01315 [Candidatus Peregrinibacteria bacterium]|nr:hypothetical protein [Candidatus Peregrinibacteria bacterium]